MGYAQSFLRELEVIHEKGYNTVKLCKLAGISRKTLWRARNNPQEVTICTADKIVHAIHKIPTLPFEFRKPQGD